MLVYLILADLIPVIKRFYDKQMLAAKLEEPFVWYESPIVVEPDELLAK